MLDMLIDKRNHRKDFNAWTVDWYGRLTSIIWYNLSETPTKFHVRLCNDGPVLTFHQEGGLSLSSVASKKNIVIVTTKRYTGQGSYIYSIMERN